MKRKILSAAAWYGFLIGFTLIIALFVQNELVTLNAIGVIFIISMIVFQLNMSSFSHRLKILDTIMDDVEEIQAGFLSKIVSAVDFLITKSIHNWKYFPVIIMVALVSMTYNWRVSNISFGILYAVIQLSIWIPFIHRRPHAGTVASLSVSAFSLLLFFEVDWYYYGCASIIIAVVILYFYGGEAVRSLMNKWGFPFLLAIATAATTVIVQRILESE